jgi:hypothetical protein
MMPFLSTFLFSYVFTSETMNTVEYWIKLMRQIVPTPANDSSGTSWQS